MKRLPIQWKFALWSALATLAGLIVFALGTLVNVYREQMEAIDLTISAESQRLMTHLERNPEDYDTSAEFHPWMALAVFGEDGRLLKHSRLDEHVARAALTREGKFTHPGRPFSWRLTAYRGPAGRTFVIAHDLAEMYEVMEDLLLSYLMMLPVVLVGAALGGAWVAHLALAPIRELADTAAAIEAGRLGRRVPEPRARDDLRRLAVLFNAMMERLESAFEQMQRFTADASHELRTPLTIMRGEAERLLHNETLPPEAEARLLSIQEEISRVDRITEQLLLMATLEAGGLRDVREPVDFSALVAEACEDAELLAASDQVTLTAQIAPGCQVEGDALLLRRLVLNVLGNALRHNQPHGRAECELTSTAGRVCLTVRNTGPEIPAHLRSQLFRRFFRVDPSRGGRGHGLGLALSRDIARAHHGDVKLSEPRADGLIEFTVVLPALVMNRPV